MIIQPAKRTANVHEYYFSRKLQEIEEMNRQGMSVINLGIGAPDRQPPLAAIETLVREAWQPGNHVYQSYKGIQELREGFAAWYKKYYRVDLDPQTEIQPLAGSKEGILLLSLAFLDKGDRVLVPNPGYPTYSSASLLAEAEIVNYDLIEEGGWMPDFEQLEKMNLQGVKMMWTNYPNMPTGAPGSPELYKRLVDFGLKHRIMISNDNPYSFILNESRFSILEIPRAKECCVELNSLSKAYHMSGWRIGMIAGAKDVISMVLKVKSNQDSGMFKPLQLAAVKALAQGDEWYEQLNQEYRERQLLAAEIFDLLEISYDKNSSGMFLWGKIPAKWENGEVLSDFILQRARVFITPGFIFGSNGDRFVRISLCARQEILKEAADRIRECLTIDRFSHGSYC